MAGRGRNFVASGDRGSVHWISFQPSSDSEGKKFVSIALVAAGAVAVSVWALPSIANYLSFVGSPSSATRKNEKQTQPGHPGADNDAKVLLKLTSAEAANGCEKQVSYTATVGSQVRQRTATLKIPAGVSDGRVPLTSGHVTRGSRHVMRVKGKGGGESDANCGDLLLELLVEPGDQDDDDYCYVDRNQ